MDFRVDSGDLILKFHLETAQKTATYISRTVQNEIISITGTYIQECCIFSAIADESRDCSNVSKCQSDLLKKEIQVLFITFIKCEQSTTRENLAALDKKQQQHVMKLVWILTFVEVRDMIDL